MKIIFFGTPQFAVPTLEHLLAADGFEVMAVVTQPDKRRSRGKKLLPSPVKIVAEANDLPVWQPSRIKKDAPTLANLREASADAFVVVAYGQILSQEILDMPKLGCINGHGSILPRYRGAAPIQWCLCNGETVTGMTTMLMDAGMDTGAMLLKSEVSIGLLENADELAVKLANLGADLMVDTLLKLEGQLIRPIPQDDTLATYAPLIKKEDYPIDWSKPAIELHDRIRGFYPNCTTQFRGQALKIQATAPLGEEYWSQLPVDFAMLQPSLDAIAPQSDRPGEVVGLAKKLGPIVQTGDGLLLLRQVQLAGKKARSGWDFANGTRLEVGEVLG
ncbi:methionyl-tRNA formyltransferase [Oscillatoriales cyanobacterium LEGE 11467]|uniref:Methionyl-tRNA formyltransferase n=1 Tax=Zarconia navalis LEGE 11467 TaxID=1828826 RepID=A0A928W257_9CYAN|nr:methionyl-tRNA formyltransferase [Zarconia navalis]MBE9041850.1 methionyl-tRNA formyltransferase [Zarconia navalis LEGE 11467]